MRLDITDQSTCILIYNRMKIPTKAGTSVLYTDISQIPRTGPVTCRYSINICWINTLSSLTQLNTSPNFYNILHGVAALSLKPRNTKGISNIFLQTLQGINNRGQTGIKGFLLSFYMGMPTPLTIGLNRLFWQQGKNWVGARSNWASKFSLSIY